MGQVPAPFSGTRLPDITAPVTIDGATGGASRVVLHGPGFTTTIGPGLRVTATAAGTVIRNLVINNFGGVGLDIRAANVTVTGNYIGTDATGALAQGNWLDGVWTATTGAVLVGGTNPGDANVIAFNFGWGVNIASYPENTGVRGNSIHDNLFGGILGPYSQAPVVSHTGASISGTACAGCTVDVFVDRGGEGRTWLGATLANGSNGSWILNQAAPGPRTTATATSVTTGTSAFSAPYQCSDFDHDGICDDSDDSDGDGVVDALDNCITVANPNQRDTQFSPAGSPDGYGNLCDPDFDNNGTVNINDFNRLKARLNITPVADVDTDLDGNGVVNINDLNRLKSYLGKSPGPSGPHLTCAPGTVGCGWHDGDIITYPQGDWGDDGSMPSSAAVTLLRTHYQDVYAPYGVFVLGIPSGFEAFFSGADTLFAYLPAGGTAGPLNTDLIDPTSSAAGDYGGDVAALKLNVDFADFGLLQISSAPKFGDLTMCNMPIPALNGTTVRQFLDIASTALGGGAAPYTYGTLDLLTGVLTAAFITYDGGGFTVYDTGIAHDHLVSGACP